MNEKKLAIFAVWEGLRMTVLLTIERQLLYSRACNTNNANYLFGSFIFFFSHLLHTKKTSFGLIIRLFRDGAIWFVAVFPFFLRSRVWIEESGALIIEVVVYVIDLFLSNSPSHVKVYSPYIYWRYFIWRWSSSLGLLLFY